MDSILFIAWLYIMGGASVAIAISDHSLGWFIGGIVFFVVADFARRQFKKEKQAKHEGDFRFSFVAVAMLVMIVAIYAMYWLSTSV
jgi:hypothetical protein